MEDENPILLIDYGNSATFSNVVEEFNKQLVIYGINKEISMGTTTLKDKLSSLNLEFEDKEEKDLKTLYYYSLDLINKYQKNEIETPIQESQDNINEYALNLYQKLLTYSKTIPNQEKNDPNGLDITTINATENYENEVYVTSKSWYYIRNNQVYAYLNFSIGKQSYDYCFLGSSQYTHEICSE